MERSTLRFVSRNEDKLAEATTILAAAHVKIVPVSLPIDEIQSTNMDLIVRDKVSKAFSVVGRPLIVEQTGLYLKLLNGLPGGLTQAFWDTLEADEFSKIFGCANETSVVARTAIGYTDGKKIHIFEGEVRGSVANSPRGPRKFQWDCIFIPDGYNETFAELGEKKNEISMRRQALNCLVTHLRCG